MIYQKQKEERAALALQVNKITLLDKIVILAALVVAIMLLLFINLYVYNGTATGVEIQYDGKPYATYSFKELPREKTLEIKTDIGYNIIRIANNTVVLSESSCDDGICKDIVISKPNQSIVCLPNKLLIRLTGKNEIDSVSY